MVRTREVVLGSELVDDGGREDDVELRLVSDTGRELLELRDVELDDVSEVSDVVVDELVGVEVGVLVGVVVGLVVVSGGTETGFVRPDCN